MGESRNKICGIILNIEVIRWSGERGGGVSY